MTTTGEVKMRYEVSDFSRLTTLRCEKCFACLEGIPTDLCVVEECCDGVAYFIRCRNAEHCTYQIPYQGKRICTCPIRKEIYNKYNV